MKCACLPNENVNLNKLLQNFKFFSIANKIVRCNLKNKLAYNYLNNMFTTIIAFFVLKLQKHSEQFVCGSFE